MRKSRTWPTKLGCLSMTGCMEQFLKLRCFGTSFFFPLLIFISALLGHYVRKFKLNNTIIDTAVLFFVLFFFVLFFFFFGFWIYFFISMFRNPTAEKEMQRAAQQQANSVDQMRLKKLEGVVFHLGLNLKQMSITKNCTPETAIKNITAEQKHLRLLLAKLATTFVWQPSFLSHS